MDGGAWQAHGVAKSQTQLSNFTSLHFMITSSHTLLPFSCFSTYRNGSNTEENIRCAGGKNQDFFGGCIQF